ncbi:hypothetical protein [Anaerofustis stercorihominis]|uniref:hypothetical protein n=1 Tax=Anaerofustis stercorihominis TaxID=214853 RepID=UPI0039840233
MSKAEFKWDYWKRIELQGLLRLGYSLTQVEKIWKNDYGYSPTIVSISKEVKRGLSEDDYQKRLYLNYDVYTVYVNVIGEDAVNFIKNHK